jgi:hypothetical protein
MHTPSRRCGWILTFMAGACGIGDSVWAQPGSPGTESRVELWGAATVAPSGPAGVLATAYSPPLLFDGGFTSRGEQTLTARSEFGFGITGGLNVFPSAHAGFQILLDRAACTVAGMNGPYVVSLQYISRQPPNDEPQTVNVRQSFDWPATSGTLTQMAVGFDAVVRLGRPDRLAMTASAGPTYFRVGGSVQPLGFTTFRLGGRSVLFEDDYRLAMSLASANVLGFNAGGELSAAVGRRTAIVVGYRYFGAADRDVAVRPTSVLNADQVTFEQTIGEIASRLGPNAMRVSVSGSRVVMGVKVMLRP